MNHTHINFYNGKKIDDGHNGIFSWIECSCGLTGINDNGKEVWNEKNIDRKGVLIYK